MKKYIVIMWGEEGLTNEIGFVNFWKLCTCALTISPSAYIGWCRLTETACVVIPVKGIGKAIDTLLEFNPIADIRIMSETLVDSEIVEVSEK